MTADRDASGGRPVLRAAIAAAVYAALALWSVRVILPTPSTTTTLPAGWPNNLIGDIDQAIMVWTTSRNARTLVTQPWRLQELETCYPTPHASGFGAPYYSDGILAIPAYLVGAPPVLMFNSVVLLQLWLSAFGMYLLALYWTRDFWGALLAGVAFGFHPARILASHWPHIIGNEWVPFILLFTHRLFAGERWRDAVGLAAFLGIQTIGCFYQFIPLAVIGAVYAPVIAFHHRGRLVALLPKLLLVVGVTAAMAAVQFWPALHVQRTWGILTGRFNLSEPFSRLLPGGTSNPGIVVLLLVVVALVDRVRSRRTVPADDPRLPLFVAGLMVVWTIVFSVPIPFTTAWIPSLLALIGHAIPGLSSALSAVRGIQFGRMGVYVCTTLLAGYGVAALRRGRSPGAARVIGIVLVGMLLAEVYVPALAVRSYSNTVDLQAVSHGLDPAITDLERRTLTGPVLDLPTGPADSIWSLLPKAHALWFATFHQRPIAACYNSFNSPLWPEVIDLADRLPAPGAADALHALGFENVVVHGDLLGGERAAAVVKGLENLQTAGRTMKLGVAAEHWVFALRSPVGVSADFAALTPPVDTAPVQRLTAPTAEVGFRFRNARRETYRHPDPVEPREVLVRWYDQSGVLASEQRLLTLLPVSLAADEEKQRTLTLATPAAPGVYRVTLARAAEADQVLAVAPVELAPAP